MAKRKTAVSPLNPIQVVLEELRAIRGIVNNLTQAGVATIHAIDKDFYIMPVQGEVEWHYPWYRSYVWHEEKWMPLMPPTLHIKVKADDRSVPVMDGIFKFALSRDMDDFYLMDAEAYITTTGSCTVTLRNDTQGQELLSVPLTIESGEKHTRYATSKRVINPLQCHWADEIWINVDSVGGDVKGLGVFLVFAAKPSIVDLNTHDG